MERLLGLGSMMQLSGSGSGTDMGGPVPLQVGGAVGGLSEDSSADSFWASLHESALFANDFLLGSALGQHGGSRNAASHEAQGAAYPLAASSGLGRSAASMQLRRELIETSTAHQLDSLRDGESVVSSFALSGIVEEEDEDDKDRMAEEGRQEDSDSEEEKEGKEKEEEEEEVRVEVSHIMADLLALSSAAGESSFSALLEKRVQLLRRIHEACARQRSRLQHHHSRGLHRAGRPATIEWAQQAREDVPQHEPPSVFESFGFVRSETAAVPAQKKSSKKSVKGRKGDNEEEEEAEVNPKQQTMQALIKLLGSTKSESQLRENASNILQLFSDLPPFSLFHEEHSKTLDEFEELLTSFLSGGQARGSKQPSTIPSLHNQAQALLLILALMRGSIKASLEALTHLLDPPQSQLPAADERTTSPNAAGAVAAAQDPSETRSKVREEALRSVVPYLKQLEDYRKHKELCSLFEEAYQGMWRYNWSDHLNPGLGSPFGLQSSSGVPGAALPSIASDGRYLYIMNSKEGLLKVGTGIVGTHTIRGHVYAYKTKYATVQSDQRGWLVYVNNCLYYKPPHLAFPRLLKINPQTLEEETEVRLSTLERDSLQPNSIINSNHVPIFSDGRYIYLVAEVRATPKSEFKLFSYDPLQGFKCISATALQGPHTLSGQHNGVVCDGCQRYAFRGQRYKCTDGVCREYNLCHTCHQLGITNRQHQKEHLMDVIAEPQASNGVPALAPQCLVSGYWFTTGHQLGVLLPAGVPPNTLRRGKMMCRVFSIRQGRHVNDLMVENWHNGQCICFDRKNNLLWMHAPDTSSVMRWTHQGKTSPSFVQTDPMTMLMRYVLPQGKATPQQALSRQKAAMILLANISILAKRSTSTAELPAALIRSPVRAMLKSDKIPFVTESYAQSGDTLTAIYTLVERALSYKKIEPASGGGGGARPDEPLPEGEEDVAATGLSVTTPYSGMPGSFVVSSLLQVLAANLQHLTKTIASDEAAKSFGLVLLDIRDLLLRLALGRAHGMTATTTTTTTATASIPSVPSEKSQDRVIQADARRCLLIGFPIFYTTQEKQRMFLHELLVALRHEETEQQQPLVTLQSPTRLLLDEILEKLSQELALGDLLFASLVDESRNLTLSPALQPTAQRQRKQTASKAPSKGAITSGENLKDNHGAEVTTKESSEKVIRELLELAINLMRMGSEEAKSKRAKIEEEVKSLLFDSEGVGVGPTAAEEASTIYNVMLAVQRDLLSTIGFASDPLRRSFSTSEESELQHDNTDHVDGVKRLLRWAALVIEKSVEMISLILPRSSLRENEASITATDYNRARYFVNRLSALRDSLLGVVLPPLLVSLYHFADRLAFVDALPALLGLLWELDEMNQFFVGSKPAFAALHEADEAEKRKNRQEAAAQSAASEAARTPSYKERNKARGRRKSNTPMSASPAVSARSPFTHHQQQETNADVCEAPLVYPHTWLVELEKTLAALCGKLAGTLVAGSPYGSNQKAQLAHLRSHLLSAGLEDGEENSIAAALHDSSLRDGMDTVPSDGSLDMTTGSVFKRLVTADESDEELGSLIKWISSAGPRLPIPAQAEPLVTAAVRATFAAVVKHANLESELREWAAALKTPKKESDDDEMQEASICSPPSALQAILSAVGSIRLWIMQKQQTILSEAMQKYEEELKKRETKREVPSDRPPARQMNDERSHIVTRVRHSLQQLQQQLLQQNVQLNEDVMWEIMVEEEEDQLREDDDDDDDDEEDDDIDEEEGNEEIAEEEEEEEEEVLGEKNVLGRQSNTRVDPKGKKKASSSSEAEDEDQALQPPTREDVYMRLAKQVLDGANFLLRFAPSSDMRVASPQQLAAQARVSVSFIQLLLPPEPLEDMLKLHASRSRSRCRGLRNFIDLIDRCSLPSAKREIIKHLGPSLRRTGNYYLAGLEGCSRSSLTAVRNSFAELFQFLLNCLAQAASAPAEQPAQQQEACKHGIAQRKYLMLLLNALALDYRMRDYALFSGSNFYAILSRLSTCDATADVESSSTSSVDSSSVVTKLLIHRKRIVRVARNLFLLSAARCLAWNPLPRALKSNHLNEDEALRIRDLQDAVLQRILFTELGSHRGGNGSSTPRLPRSDFNDDYHHSLLALLYKLKRTPTMSRFFSSSESIRNLLYLLKVGSPRVQRLVSRLCRHVIGHLRPEHFHVAPAATDSASAAQALGADETVEFFIDLLGSLISGGSLHNQPLQQKAATDTTDTISSKLANSRAGDVEERYSVILHRPQGITVSDVLRMLPQNQLTSGDLSLDVGLKDIIRELKAIDQTVVIRDSSIEKCCRCASLLASKGFCVTIARPGSAPKRNIDPDSSSSASSSSQLQFYTWRSRRVDLALASEIVSLLRTLLLSPDWHALLRDKLSAHLGALSELVRTLDDHTIGRDKAATADTETNSSKAMFANQQRILAVLAVLGGWTEDIRVGGQVRLHDVISKEDDDLDQSTTGTVLSLSNQATIKVLVKSRSAPEARQVRVCSAENLTPIAEMELPSGTFPLSERMMEDIYAFLAKFDALLGPELTTADPSPTALLFAQLRSRLLMVLSRVFQDSSSISRCLEMAEHTDSGLLPLLINTAIREDMVRALPTEVDKPSTRAIVKGENDSLIARLTFDIQELLHERESRPKPNRASIEEPRAAEAQPADSAVLPASGSRRDKSKRDTRRKKDLDKKTKTPKSGKGKNKLDMEDENEERIRTALSSSNGALQGKMAWSEDIGYALVFLGLDRLSVQYFGSNGDCLVHALPAISAETTAEFYFEVTIDSDDSGSSIGVGLCPAGAVPGWGDCFYEYRGANGNKIAPRQRKDNELAYRCPYCEQDKLSAAELCHHIQRRHHGSTLAVVCPICASTPLGDPNYISSNFFGHLENTHSDLLYGPVPSSQELSYGPSFSVGDTIGCGWSRREGGVIYFTRNGEYLGPAFLDVSDTRLVPMIRLRSSGTEVSANFGHRTFACPPTQDLAEKDSEMVRKLREDQEAQKRRLREAEDERLAAREAQAELLMSFVGLPKEFCIYALIHNNDNVEEAASWSFDHFNQWSAEQAHAQALNIQQERRSSLASSPSDSSGAEGSSTSTVTGRSIDYPGEAYAFPDDVPVEATTRTISASSSPVMAVSRLRVGTKCVVTDRALDVNDPTGWVDAKYRAVGRTGEVVSIDRTRLVALLQFYDPERAVSEEWWFPLQSLAIASNDARSSPTTTDNSPDSTVNHSDDDDNNASDSAHALRETLLTAEMRLAQLYARGSIINLLKNWPTSHPLSLALIGGASSFLQALRLIARAHLAQPVPELRQAHRLGENDIMNLLWSQLQRLCRAEEMKLLDLLLSESAGLLKQSAAFSSRLAVTSESEHPFKAHATDEFVQEFSIPDALGLVITFDRRCKLSDADLLTIHLDEKCTKPVRRLTGASLAQFSPVVIRSNRFWLQFQRQSGVLNNEPQWGYLVHITPTNELLNLALWLSEFLAEEATSLSARTDSDQEQGMMVIDDSVEGSIYNRLYVHLTNYLRNAKAPDTIKTVVVRLLNRLLKLDIDNFIAEWNKGSLRKRKIAYKEENREDEDTPTHETVTYKSSEEEQESIRLRRDNLRRNMQRLADATSALEEEMFELLCEVDLLHSAYLQNLAELVVLKRKVAILAKSNLDDSIATTTLSFYPRSLDDVPSSFPTALSVSSSGSLMAESAMHEGIRNFNALAAIDEILACLLGEKDFPQSFFAEFHWDPRSLYISKSARLSSLNKPKLTDEGRLTERAEMVYTEVFYRFGVSQPGWMSREELNMLQVHCHPGEPLSADDLNFFFKKYETEGGRLTLRGFLSLYYHDAYNHPKHSWEELQRLGYDSELAISEPIAIQWCAATRWSQAMDEQLVELVNYLSEKTGKRPLDLIPDDIDIKTDVERKHYNHLQHLPAVALKLRFCCIKQFNVLVSKALPFIDLTQQDVEGSLAQRMCSLRHVVFYLTKAQFLDSILARTATTRPSPSITIARMKSVLRSSRDSLAFLTGSGPALSLSAEAAAQEKTVFMQVYKQLSNVDPACLRQNERAFKVTLRGERVEGEVGPYQETISQLCSELQPEDPNAESGSESSTSTSSSTSVTDESEAEEALPLFIPCPNRQQAMQLIGVGENRDKFILKPSSSSAEHLRMFEFLGKLMGIAARTKSILSLNLPALFWKPLVGVTPSLADLKSIDYSTMESLQRMLEMDKDLFASSIFQNFTASLSDKTIVELGSGGKERMLTYEDRKEYVALTQQARLHESDVQLKSIWKGMGTLIPLPILNLFTWQDLEMRICGRTEINLDVLRRNTRYRAGVAEQDAHIRYFWQVLESFGHHERMLFLRFAWGRQRLPSESELKNEPLKIFPFPCDNADNRLPHAETCFFNIKLPAYSSVDVMRERLLYAITHTKTIDADLQEDNIGELLARGGRGRGRGGRFLGGLGGAVFGRSPFGDVSSPPVARRGGRGRGFF